MSRLRPLLAGLPPSSERITFWENFERFGAKVSNKLLILMAFGAVASFAGTTLNVTNAMPSHRPIDNPVFIAAGIVSIASMAQVACLAIVKVRAQRKAP
jgi:hypothetical protein